MRNLLIVATFVAPFGGSLGCRLNPLVGDKPGASVHVLPSGTTIPSVTTNAELTNQITLNDGLDPKALMMSGGVVMPGTGMSAGAAVDFWSFGATTRAPAPLYLFFSDSPSG